ncbi:A1pp-domain-containing protein [Dipodascopsis tothii]|uniref:A1pp-domain-containing protein n=1 Tax=Dipodascopsis tothii TaxID=44089 RepID=UPI0034CF708B
MTELQQIPTIAQLYAKRLLTAAPRALAASAPGLNAKVSVVRADITKLKVDAIVNAANTRLGGGSGVNGAIHAAAGPNLPVECSKIGGCETGDAKITSGCDLPARFIIHTVGPVYHEHAALDSKKLLVSCYSRSLKVGLHSGATSIAFSSISTGVFGYPIEDATLTAVETVREFLEGPEGAEINRVLFVVFSAKDEQIYHKVVPMFFPE